MDKNRRSNVIGLGMNLFDPAKRYPAPGAVLTLAPLRRGKGLRVMHPNLLAYPGMVIIDNKGGTYTVPNPGVEGPSGD